MNRMPKWAWWGVLLAGIVVLVVLIGRGRTAPILPDSAQDKRSNERAIPAREPIRYHLIPRSQGTPRR